MLWSRHFKSAIHKWVMVMHKINHTPSSSSFIRDSATSPALMNKLLPLLLILIQFASESPSPLAARRCKNNGEEESLFIASVTIAVVDSILFVVVLGSAAAFVCSGDDGENASTCQIADDDDDNDNGDSGRRCSTTARSRSDPLIDVGR